MKRSPRPGRPWSCPALAAALAASLLSVGCGEEVVYAVKSDTGGAGGGGTTAGTTVGPASSSASTGAGEPGIVDLRAPERTTVRIDVTAAVVGAPMSPAAYAFSSEHGPLEVTAVAWDAGAKAILLETAKQKLGVEYTLTIQAPGDPLDGLGGAMLAADTAVFWATDFSTFEPYELVAERVGVGERVVLYVETGYSADDVDETIVEFDGQIFPIETELLHAAPDRDENGRVVLLGLDGQSYYGGYFSPFNALTDDLVSQWGYHSNEMEMVYLNVAALGGFWPDVVVAHEFGHLLYQEQHSFLEEPEYFQYHNEGLAECAVHAVYGGNPISASYYVDDPEGQLATGKSLVHWDDGNYTQYAQAYVFWTYVASRLGGVDGYRDIFQSYGSPEAIGDLLLAKLGSDFVSTQLTFLAAAWLQQPSGPLGFEGMLELPTKPAVVPPGTTSLQLAPFAGAFFPQLGNGVTPGGAGPNVRFLGIGGAGQIDEVAPFDAAGGVVIALNGHLDWNDASPEPSGALGGGTAAVKIPPGAAGRDPSWLHPPPLPPTDGGALRAWRKRTSGF